MQIHGEKGLTVQSTRWKRTNGANSNGMYLTVVKARDQNLPKGLI